MTAIDLNQFDPQKHTYRHWQPVRLVITLVALGAITYGIGQMVGADWSKALDLFKGKLPLWKMTVIVGSTGLTIGALAMIFHKAIYGQDSAAKRIKEVHGQKMPHRGNFLRDDHWVPIKYFDEARSLGSWHRILDISTLDKSKSGIAYAYTQKRYSEASFIAAMSGLVAGPVYPIAIAIYQLTVGWILRSMRNKNTNPFFEFARSVKIVIESPFYALAYMIAQLAVFVDPRNGRKLVANIERDWHGGVLVQDGWALAWGRHSLKNDMGMQFGKEGHSAFFVDGCFQPTEILTFKDGVLEDVKSANGFTKSEDRTVEKRWKDDN